MMPRCFLAPFAPEGKGRCDGRLIKAHLLPRQLLKKTLKPADANRAINDPRSWVWGCGGPMGNAGHHGMLDTSRTLKIPRLALPLGLECLAIELGFGWFLSREYGPAPDPAVTDCVACLGSGEIMERARDPQEDRSFPCPECDGGGVVRVLEPA